MMHYKALGMIVVAISFLDCKLNSHICLRMNLGIKTEINLKFPEFMKVFHKLDHKKYSKIIAVMKEPVHLHI